MPGVGAGASATLEVEERGEVPTSLPEMGAAGELASPVETPTSSGKKRGSKVFKFGRFLSKRLVSS